MYKALIVDDEKMIRNGIQRMIPWDSIGIGAVFAAESGEEALELIQRESPDIMLTDLHMTQMDGLTLIERANALHPEMRIIVLTGYDNFEYVQKCCRMNVQDFILKPADEEELTRILRAQKEELDKRRGAEYYQKAIRRTQGMAEQLRLEQTLRGLLGGGLPVEEALDALEEYHYRPDQPMQAVIIVPTPNAADQDWSDFGSLLTMSVKGTCMSLFDSNYEGITFEDEQGQIVLALFTGNTGEETIERMEKLCGLLRTEYAIRAHIVIGGAAAGFAQLAGSYRDACLLLEEAPRDRAIVQTGSDEHRLQIFSDVFREIKGEIVANYDNQDKMLRAFASYTTAVESYNLSASMVRRHCFDLACATYYRHVCDTGEPVSGKLTALLSSMLVCSREEACKFTFCFLSQMSSDGDGQSNEIISQAKQYINEHLSEDLSVSSIAEQMYVSPNYFSRLFKRVTGEGCNEYIVRQRMEMAKSLLMTTDYKTGKIASMAGYHDTNYFSLAFKKYSGYSPTSYRECIK